MSRLDDGFPLMLEREAGMRAEVPEVAVAFGLYPVVNKKLTLEKGMECYDDKPHVKIAIPNEQKTVVFALADETYKRRFPQAWAAFERRQTKGITEGLPIDMWPPITKGQALTLIAGHILTVESLAAMSGELLKKFPDWVVALNAKAIGFLKMAEDSAATTKAEDEKKKLQGTIEALQAQINQLQERELERQQREEQGSGGKKGKAA